MTYEIGLAVAGNRCALVVERAGRRRTHVFPCAARDGHNVAMEGVNFAASLDLAHAEPRVVYLRQLTVAQALRDELLPHGLRVEWRGPKSPDGDHPLVTAALSLLPTEHRL